MSEFTRLYPIGTGRVKSCNFGHQVISDIYLQTVEIQMRRLLLSRLIVCLVDYFLFQLLRYETNKVAVRIYLMSEVTARYECYTVKH